VLLVDTGGVGVRLPSPAQCFGLSGGFSPPPPVFANGANGAKDDLGDVRGYVTVQTLGDVGVNVQGDRHVSVPEPLLDHLGMLAGLQCQRRLGMPKIMQPDGWQFDLGHLARNIRENRSGCSGPPSGRSQGLSAADDVPDD